MRRCLTVTVVVVVFAPQPPVCATRPPSASNSGVLFSPPPLLDLFIVSVEPHFQSFPSRSRKKPPVFVQTADSAVVYSKYLMLNLYLLVVSFLF